MYKIRWDEETLGLLLVNSIEEDKIISPRPVFFEELDLLGLDKYWDYPKCEEPLLWNIRRRYYYKGEVVAEVKGGNIFEDPKVILTDKGKNLSLEPVNVRLMVEKNKEILSTLEDEAMNFVQEVYDKYKNEVDFFVVSFSGGKDSQVVLDIVSRTLSPDDYIVIFTDTTMEIPPTYEAYERTKEYYKKLYPNLKFYVARNEKHSLELWKIFGPPSRIIRWCCSVYKTSPQVRLLRALNPEKGKIRVLTFEGVRAEESARRSKYERIAQEVKHYTVVNSRVIFRWSSLEVFLYLFFRSLRDKGNRLLINDGYRLGLSRVGCSICPFGSQWSEFVIKKNFPSLADGYIKIIEAYIKKMNLSDIEIKDYILKGQWKKRGGGKVLGFSDSLFIISEYPVFKAILTTGNNIQSFFEWIKILGNVNLLNHDTNSSKEIYGEILVASKTYNFKIVNTNNNKYVVELMGVSREASRLFKKLFNKAVYCKNCGVCEAECISGALKTIPYVTIDSGKCKHCLSCLKIGAQGCLRADSLYIPKKFNTQNYEL